MANHTKNQAKYELLTGALNFLTADIRLLLCMTNTTADTDMDANTIGAFATLDECDAPGYTAGGVALTGETVAEDAAGNRAYFDANDASFANLAAGTRQIQGMLLYRFVTSVAASTPLAWIDTPGFPFWGNGSTVNVQWNANGILQVA